MTASLVSLFRARPGWTNEERAQFARIERLLEDAGFAVDVEHGLSDEGEPWCVFCSRATGDVVIHVACIDGRFMFDSTTLPRPIEGASFQRCAERFFEDVSLPMPLAERRSRVYLHPSAMLASLFITILLYAQATTEQPLFAEEAVDVDDPDAPLTPENPLAVRLKAIAQQVADLVHGPETGQPAQPYVNPAISAIPAGMALAVIAIAQDLAQAGEAAQLLDDETAMALAALVDGTGETTASLQAPDLASEEPEAEAERRHADYARVVPEGEREETSGAPSGETDLGAEVAALFAEFADYAEATTETALEALGRLADFDVVRDDDMAALAQAQETEMEEPGPSAVAALTDLFVDALELARAPALDSFVFTLEGQSVGIDLVLLADGAFDRFATALLAEFAEGEGAVVVAKARVEGGGAEGDALAPVAIPDAPSYSVSGEIDMSAGGLGTTASASGEDPDLSDRTPTPAPAPAPPSDATVVTLEEAKDLAIAFVAAVGDTRVYARDGVAMPEADDLDTMLDSLLAAGRDTTFFDATLTDRGSVDFGSRNLHVEYLYLEDQTKLTFYAHAPEFDGFA